MGRVGGKNAALPLSLTSVFEEACPLYLLYGMTYEQFWDGDVSAHKAFREAFKMRKRAENSLAYLQAVYFFEALCDASPLFRGMKPSKPKMFRDEPYEIFQEDRIRKEEKEARERYERIKRNVAAFAKARKEKTDKEREVEENAG